MKLGLMFANTIWGATGPGAVELADAAEAGGFESIWTVEHVVVPSGYESKYPYAKSGKMAGGEEEFDLPDPLIWLSYVAARTTRLKLGTGILILPQRNPLIVAKELASLDALSGGRMILGIGVGWLAEEFEALGVPFGDRGARCADTVEILRKAWTGEKVSHSSPFAEFTNCISRPRPTNGTIHELCADAAVPLVEDCAHSLGAVDHRGRAAGTGTAGACFSFYATKNLTSGEGGALATDDAELARFARSYRLHGLSVDAWTRYQPGSTSGYDLMAAGIKGNLPDILAALARSQLRRFDAMQAHRRHLVERYRNNLAGAVGFVPHRSVEGSADHLMVVVLPDRCSRADVVARMAERGVSTSVHFRPLHTFGWFAEHALLGPGGAPNAERLAARVVSLPLHTSLTDDDVDHIGEVLIDCMD